MSTICKKNTPFEECELAVMRSAIDKSKARISSKPLDGTVVKIIKTVEKFIRQEKCVCYGGTAINNILPKKDQFYNFNEEIPDYDFFSDEPIKHATQLVDIYVKEGYKEVEAKSGIHMGTYKVFVNFIPIADITLMDKSLYKVLQKNSIKKDGIMYCPPNYLRMSMYLELSRPMGDTSRWEKVLKRLTLLNKHYKVENNTCNYETFQREYEGEQDQIDNINNIIRTVCSDNKCVFFGGYANYLYSKYMPYNIRSKFTKHPDFDVLSIDPESVSSKIKKKLEHAGHTAVVVTKHDGIQDIISTHYEIKIDNDLVCFIYKPLGCHSYNNVKINKDTIRVATIDTMLSFYLAFMYINKPYYDTRRIICMSKFLFDVQQQNRLKQKGILTRFSIDCYGEQTTLEQLRETKANKFKELKDKTSEEYKQWFLKYSPVTHDNTKNTSTNTTNSLFTKTLKRGYKTKSKKQKTRKNKSNTRTKKTEKTINKIHSLYNKYR